MKYDELTCKFNYMNKYRNCAAICFTERWLDSTTAEDAVTAVFDGYSTYRMIKQLHQ